MRKLRLIDKVAFWIYGKLGADGLLHILVISIIFKILWLIFGFYLGLIITVGSGYLKELYDKRTGGKVDTKDLVADCIGISLTILLNA